MAENENKVKPGNVDDKTQNPENLTADGVDKNAAEKSGEGLKITGITFIKGAADKADGSTLPPTGEQQDKTPKDDKGEKPPVGGKDDKIEKPSKGGKDEKTDKPPKIEKPEKPSKVDKVDKSPKKEKVEKPKKTRAARPPDGSKRGKAASVGGAGSTPQEKTAAMAKAAIEKAEAPPVPEPPKAPPRSEVTEEIVQIPHAELFAFKDHPFRVRDDEAMKNLVQSIKERGVDQPALVRPKEGGGYELVAGHRRQHASEQAGYTTVPCIVRNMTDEEAVLAMAETNFNQRESILASEKAQALKMQLDAIKRQGARFDGVAQGDIGKRSVEIIAERNSMNYKTVQRYIALNNLVPEVMKLADEGKLKFIPAFEMSYIGKKNQQYIAMTIESEERVPTLAQVQRMRELDQKNQLTPTVIDGIMLEENKKEDRKVVFNSQELDKYFSADKTPAEMKAVILKAMDEYKEKQPLEFGKQDKPKEKDI